MEPELNSLEMQNLCEAITSLRTPQEAKKFLRDLCTLGELKNMAERFAVAKALQKGLRYREIAEKTGSSTATITRVAHWLHHGMNGYKLVLHRR